MPARIDVSLAASITVVVGSSGSGKSAWLKRQIKTARRLIVWDPDDEYGGAGFHRVTTIAQLAEALRGASAGRFAFVPASPAQFDAWSLCAFAWGNCVAVAEETADVTTPGKAPPGWGTLVRRGRKRGITLYAVTQRPSESDKTVIGNATCLHVCMLARAADRQYMARELDVQQSEIDRIAPLEWIEKRRGVPGISRGKLKF
ncbi:MAG TPA: hypothetical protein VFM56_10580 [Solimonas sp.]|nr:hypothetical protein [Solimonas sp.]